MPSSADTSLYDVLVAHDQIDVHLLQPVLAGKEHATLDLLLSGGPPADGSILTDLNLWASSLRERGPISDDLDIHLLIACTDLPTLDVLRNLYAAMPEATHERARIIYWRAIHGDVQAATDIYMLYHAKPDIRAAFAEGLRRHAKAAAKVKDWRWYPGVELKILIAGAYALAHRMLALKTVVGAIEAWDGDSDRPAVKTAIENAERNWLRDLVTIARTRAYEREIEKTRKVEAEPEPAVEPVDEDYIGPDDPRRFYRAGSGLLWDNHLNEVVDETSNEPPEERTARIHAHVAQVTAEREAARPDRPTAAYPHLVVLADLQPSGGDAKAPGGFDNELIRHLGPISGRHLDLTCAPKDVAGIARSLGDVWPHALGVIDRFLRDVQPGEPIRFRPTLLVGKPGSGKTSFAREIGMALDMATTVYPCASVSDNSFGGTPMQWGTRRASTPLEAIRAGNVANPLLVLDEIEKTGTGGNHGSLLTSLLPMLERHTASQYFEVGIERPADLSYVGFIATANSLAGVPRPLLDRFRVIEMPDAGPEHLGDLARRIVADIATENGLDPAWSPPLAYDELAVIRRAWRGGSLRRLKTAIQATLDARETVLRGRPM